MRRNIIFIRAIMHYIQAFRAKNDFGANTSIREYFAT